MGRLRPYEREAPLREALQTLIARGLVVPFAGTVYRAMRLKYSTKQNLRRASPERSPRPRGSSRHCSTLFHKMAVARWLDTPNPAFDDLKPIELVERGHTDRLWRMIYELECGQPG
jgi:Protein of unknown function (DUF2384)